MPGILYVVATPIGNLEDITLRALRTLREADVVAAEDTRRTQGLLARHEISRPLVSLREHNEARMGTRLVQRLLQGESVALVADAGTPGIADPGARFVRMAREAGIRVVPLPGPSAVTTALSVSGLDASTFTFLGFPPPSGTSRRAWFDRAAAEPGVLVFYESPHRIGRTLREARSIMPSRKILVFRELTKINEELVESPITVPETKTKGEFTLVLGPSSAPARSNLTNDKAIIDLFGRMTEHAGLSDGDALALVATHFEIGERDAARIIKKHKISVKQQRQPGGPGPT